MPQSSSAKSYAWNHDTPTFVLSTLTIKCIFAGVRTHPTGNSSHVGLHIRVWDSQTGQLACKFSASSVDGIALSPTLIQHPPGVRLIALWSKSGQKCNTSIPVVYTLKFWVEHVHTWRLTRWIKVGVLYELILQGMRDGWVMGRDNEPLFWVSVERR